MFQSQYQPKGINLLILIFEFRVWTRHYVVRSLFFRVHHFSPFSTDLDSFPTHRHSLTYSSCLGDIDSEYPMAGSK